MCSPVYSSSTREERSWRMSYAPRIFMSGHYHFLWRENQKDVDLWPLQIVGDTGKAWVWWPQRGTVGSKSWVRRWWIGQEEWDTGRAETGWLRDHCVSRFRLACWRVGIHEHENEWVDRPREHGIDHPHSVKEKLRLSLATGRGKTPLTGHRQEATQHELPGIPSIPQEQGHNTLTTS